MVLTIYYKFCLSLAIFTILAKDKSFGNIKIKIFKVRCECNSKDLKVAVLELLQKY